MTPASFFILSRRFCRSSVEYHTVCSISLVSENLMNHFLVDKSQIYTRERRKRPPTQREQGRSDGPFNRIKIVPSIQLEQDLGGIDFDTNLKVNERLNYPSNSNLVRWTSDLRCSPAISSQEPGLL